MCTLATAVIHVVFAFPTPMFIASGVGYAVLLTAFFLPALRRVRGLVGATLAVFAVGNIAAWYVQGARIPLAYADKAFEVALLAVLLGYVLVARRPDPMPVRVTPTRR